MYGQGNGEGGEKNERRNQQSTGFGSADEI